MQDIAREFNFSETTFVLPAEHGNTCRVRIFTPAREIPFAGHPNVGTAFTLAGEIELDGQRTKVLFEEKAGLVAIEIHQREGGVLWCELAVPQAVSLGGKVTAGDAAAARPCSLKTSSSPTNRRRRRWACPFSWPRSGIVSSSDEPR